MVRPPSPNWVRRAGHAASGGLGASLTASGGLGAALTASGVGLALSGCGGGPPPPPPPLVRSVVVAASDAAVQRFTGVVRARTESALGFRVAGKIAERLVDPGQHVRQGQALMRLDRADFGLALTSARASSDAARALMVKTAAEEKRARRLAVDGWVSVQGYEQAKAAADAAAAGFAAAEAGASQVENQAGYAGLLADADGVVMEVAGEPGQVVGAGQPVVRLARDGPREAEIFLPEGAERMATADATAVLYAGRDAAFEARLREVAGVADPATRTYRARYVLTGPGEAAPLGATVSVALRASLRGSGAGLSVPIAALFDAGEGPAVWRIEVEGGAEGEGQGEGGGVRFGTVLAQPVSIARMDEERADIAAGLGEGDRVVALGAHLLRPGQRVRLSPERVAGAGPR